LEPEPAKFRSKGVGAIKGKWPASELKLRSFKNLAPEQEPEPIKFSQLHQPCFIASLQDIVFTHYTTLYHNIIEHCFYTICGIAIYTVLYNPWK